MKSTLFILLSFLVLFSCTNQRKNTGHKVNNTKDTSYKQIAFNKYGNDTIFIFSPKENFILCEKAIDKNSANPNTLTEFFIYDTDNNKITYEDKIAGATISWNSNTSLIITTQKGIITSPSDSGKSSYIYNLKTNKKEEIKN